MMRCTWCKAPLVTRAGEPRWDVFGSDRGSGLAFVCYGGCLLGAGGCHCAGKPTGGVYGGGPQTTGGRFKWGADGRRAVMGIDWMSRDELSQAIPPAYTRFIGEQLLAHLPTEVSPA